MKKQPFISLASLTIMIVFLLLGFCPLRNTLVSLVKPVPAKNSRKVPERAKIIAADDCTVSTTQKIAPSREPMPSGNALPLRTVPLTLPGFSVRFQRLKIPPGYLVPPVPLYLRNQVMLI
jgi:hypothetical protein